MKIWTYDEMNKKIQRDLDLQDETFVTSDEMVGYFNEALTEAESEMLMLNQDYFLTNFYLPLVAGTTRYQLPANIFANKIRGVVYKNGSLIYQLNQIRRRDKFEALALIETFGLSDDYQYLLINDNPGQAELALYPTSRDTAVMAPVASLSTPMILWYLRNCTRVPIVGEYCNPEAVALTQVNTTNDTIQTYAASTTKGNVSLGTPGGFPGSIAYVTGDKVKFSIGPGGTLPSPLVVDTVYYVIQTGSGLIKLATSLANALAGTAINLTTTGTVYFTFKVAATAAIIAATLIDIPEFGGFVMQWVKCRCMEKEGDPRIQGAIETLAQQRKQLNDTLAKGIDDDQDHIQMDQSFYNEMS